MLSNLTKLQTPCEGTWAVLVVAYSEEGMAINKIFCKIMKKEKKSEFKRQHEKNKGKIVMIKCGKGS